MTKRKVKPYVHQSRTWLNPKSGSAHCRVEVESETYGWVSAGLTLADCDRKVTLDFGFCAEPKTPFDKGVRSLSDAKKKVVLLAKQLRILENALVQADIVARKQLAETKAIQAAKKGNEGTQRSLEVDFSDE